MTLARISQLTGVSINTLRPVARKLFAPKQTFRGPVYDLSARQVKKLIAHLHGKRGRPKQSKD